MLQDIKTVCCMHQCVCNLTRKLLEEKKLSATLEGDLALGGDLALEGDLANEGDLALEVDAETHHALCVIQICTWIRINAGVALFTQHMLRSICLGSGPTSNKNPFLFHSMYGQYTHTHKHTHKHTHTHTNTHTHKHTHKHKHTQTHTQTHTHTHTNTNTHKHKLK